MRCASGASGQGAWHGRSLVCKHLPSGSTSGKMPYLSAVSAAPCGILQPAALLNQGVQAVLAQPFLMLKRQLGKLGGALLPQEVLVRAVHQRGGVNAQAQAGLHRENRSGMNLRGCAGNNLAVGAQSDAFPIQALYCAGGELQHTGHTEEPAAPARTSTERGLVGMQAAGVHPGSVARSAMSRMDSFGRLPAAAASRWRSRSASQEYTGRGRSAPTSGMGPGDERALPGLLEAPADADEGAGSEATENEGGRGGECGGGGGHSGRRGAGGGVPETATAAIIKISA